MSNPDGFMIKGVAYSSNSLMTERAMFERIRELEAENKNILSNYAVLEATIAERDKLLELIRDDLRMRSEDGVVDISDFIWQRIKRTIGG